MSHLTGELHKLCRATLLHCSEFDSQHKLQTVFVTSELRPFRGRLPEAGTKESRVSQVLAFLLEQQLTDGRHVLPLFLETLAQRYDESDKHHQALSELARRTQAHLAAVPSADRARLFICYRRNVQPDNDIAVQVREALLARGHEVFIDQSMRTGEAWLAEIDRQIRQSDYLIVLLSAESAESEMLQAEVQRAYEYRKEQGRPQTLPVRIDYEGLLPYQIAAFLNRLHYLAWRDVEDTQRLVAQIEAVITGEPHPASSEPEPSTKPIQIFSEDGRPLESDNQIPSPAAAFDPRLLASLPVPGGVVRLRDELYVSREADDVLQREIVKSGSTTTIRAPRQTGKTSLLVRGVRHAFENETTAVLIDLQGLGEEQLSSLHVFLREIAESISEELGLGMDAVEGFWRDTRSPQRNIQYFLEKKVLPDFKDRPLVLALDEADNLLKTNFHRDFFRLLRAWHNRRATRPAWRNLNMVLVIATEPYLLIDNIHESPFNVGLRLDLPDFNDAQVAWLNQKHGEPVPAEYFDALMQMFNGHPFLTRKALYVLTAADATWSQLMETAIADDGPFGDHLRRHLWGLRQQPELIPALKQVIRHERCDDEEARFRLLRAGLIQGSGDVYTCRCDLYHRYFEGKLT